MVNFNLIVPILNLQGPLGDSSPSKEGISSEIRINGFGENFKPLAQVPLVRPQIVQPTPGKAGGVVQAFFQLRQEGLAPKELEDVNVYRIELNESESLDSEEESPEALEEEVEEESDELEDSTFSDSSFGSQESDGFNEENPKESLNEYFLIEDSIKDERASKMWQRAKTSILQSLVRKSKRYSISSQQIESAPYFSLLKK